MKNIILIDDDSVSKMIFERQCFNTGLNSNIIYVASIDDAKSKIAELRRNNIQVDHIFCDIFFNNSSLTGYDFLDYYRDLYYNPSTKVHVLTSSLRSKDKIKVNKEYSWVDDYLDKGKPYDTINKMNLIKNEL